MLAATPLRQLLNMQSAMVASMKENMAGTGVADQGEKQTAMPEVSVVREESAEGESSVVEVAVAGEASVATNTVKPVLRGHPREGQKVAA